MIDILGTAVEAVQSCETHNQQTRLCCECKDAEKSILRHIHTAIEDKYIENLVDDDTCLIKDDIPTVLEYLFTKYGKVVSEEVKQKEAKVLNLVFNSAEHMVLIYKPIEQLQKLATAAQIPFSTEQQLESSLALIRCTRDFEKALIKWKAEAATDKTWNNFKLYFRDDQSELKEIYNPTMQQDGYHHANILAV